MKDYRVLIDIEALDSLPNSGKRKELVLSYLKDLINTAHLGGDFQLKDPQTLRIYEISLVAGFAITWWIDDPALSIKVIDIRPGK